MTLLQSVAVKLAMLAISVSIVYWALDSEEPRPLAPPLVAPAAADTQDTALPSTDAVSPSVSSPPATSHEAPSVSRSPSSALSRPVQKPARRRVTYPINLNTAKLEEFRELPGIGEKLAERIVAYRRAHGRFRSVEELREVKGIGKKRMDRLRPLVMTGTHD